MDHNLFYCVVCVIFQFSMSKYAECVMKHEEDEHVICKHLTYVLFFLSFVWTLNIFPNKSAKAKDTHCYPQPLCLTTILYLTNVNERKHILIACTCEKKTNKNIKLLVEFCNLIYEKSVQACVFGKIYPSHEKSSLQVTMVDRGRRIFCHFCSYQIIQVII